MFFHIMIQMITDTEKKFLWIGHFENKTKLESVDDVINANWMDNILAIQ